MVPCGKKFKCQSSMILHIRTHTGEKPFECEICHMTFATNSNRRDHMLRHDQSRPHECTECKKAFYRHNLLKDHMLKKHGINLVDKPIGKTSSSTDDD